MNNIVDKEQRLKQLQRLKQGERIERTSIDLTNNNPMKKKNGVRG